MSRHVLSQHLYKEVSHVNITQDVRKVSFLKQDAEFKIISFAGFPFIYFDMYPMDNIQHFERIFSFCPRVINVSYITMLTARVIRVLTMTIFYTGV